MRGKRSDEAVLETIKRGRGRPLKEDIERAADRAEAGPLPVAGLAAAGDEDSGRSPLASEAEWVAAAPDDRPGSAAPGLAISAGAAPVPGLAKKGGDVDQDRDGESAGDDEPAEVFLGNPATLAGDMRDRILNQIVRQEKVWQKMLNYEQSVLADQLYKICKDCVAGALKIILDVPFAHVDVAIDKLNVDKDIKLGLSTPLTGGALAKLGEALHKPACLILASASEFQGQQRAAQTDPDQPALKLEVVEAPAPAKVETPPAEAETGEPDEETEEGSEAA